jgi:hypothetical protein
MIENLSLPQMQPRRHDMNGQRRYVTEALRDAFGDWHG